MERFDSWNSSKTGSFWKQKFKPKKILNVTSFINSVISHQWDSHLLEKYDINDLSEHTPGTAYIWVEISLDKPTYDESSYPYCYVYDIDPNWLYVDAIYDKHINPTISLQSGIDYSYKQKSGKLKCKKEILNSSGTLPKLYISKGWYSEYRIYNEIGHFLEVLDTDSTTYRDSLMPLLASYYICPSYFNLLAVLNVLVGLPIAKYDDEVILSIVNGFITTNKYVYAIGTIHTHLQKGDTLKRFQPLTDVVELHTNELEPNWWIGHPTAFFEKYTPNTSLNDSLRNYIMENYLFDSIAGVEFRQDKLGTNNITLNYQLKDAFLKAAPTHSDFLFAQSYHVGTSYDIYNIMTPTEDSNLKYKLTIRSMFGRFTKNIGINGNDEWGKSSTILPRPKINDSNKYVEGISLKFGNGIWSLFNTYDAFNDRWKYLDTIEAEDPTYRVLVEPWNDTIYIRQGNIRFFKDSETKYIPYDLPEKLKPTVFMEFGTPDVDKVHERETMFSDISTIPEITEPNSASNLSIPEFLNYSAQDILNTKFPNQWECTNITGVSKDNYFFITLQTDKEEGNAISPELNIGIIPKTIVPIWSYAPIPSGAKISVFYTIKTPGSSIWSDWKDIETTGEKLKGLSGKIKFKIVLKQNLTILDGNPKVNNFRINIELE